VKSPAERPFQAAAESIGRREPAAGKGDATTRCRDIL
jgi:hypothetical protein